MGDVTRGNDLMGNNGLGKFPLDILVTSICKCKSKHRANQQTSLGIDFDLRSVDLVGRHSWILSPNPQRFFCLPVLLNGPHHVCRTKLFPTHKFIQAAYIGSRYDGGHGRRRSGGVDSHSAFGGVIPGNLFSRDTSMLSKEYDKGLLSPSFVGGREEGVVVVDTAVTRISASRRPWNNHALILSAS